MQTEKGFQRPCCKQPRFSPYSKLKHTHTHKHTHTCVGVCYITSVVSVSVGLWTVAHSSVHGILQARILEWVAMTPPRDLSDPGIQPKSPAL